MVKCLNIGKISVNRYIGQYLITIIVDGCIDEDKSRSSNNTREGSFLAEPLLFLILTFN